MKVRNIDSNTRTFEKKALELGTKVSDMVLGHCVKQAKEYEDGDDYGAFETRVFGEDFNRLDKALIALNYSNPRMIKMQMRRALKVMCLTKITRKSMGAYQTAWANKFGPKKAEPGTDEGAKVETPHEYDIAAIAAFCTEHGISKPAIAKILKQDFLDGMRKLVA